MRFHIVTLFPKLFDSYLSDSILKRAIDSKKIHIDFYNPRDYTKDKHKKVDDRPYGGGPGMVMTVQPILSAVEAINKKIARRKKTKVKTLIFVPEKTEFTTVFAKKLVSLKYTDMILICGRYEGIDARVTEILKAEEVSIGNYVLTGGELPALVIIDCISRQVDGVLGKYESLEEERISSHKVYSRPPEIVYKRKKYNVPKVLQEGNHKDIEDWKKNAVD
jgi:tRNA (guanine37-N1)-methyltransferase